MKYFSCNIFISIILILGFNSSRLFSQTYEINSKEELKKQYEKFEEIAFLNISDDSGYTQDFFNACDTINKELYFYDCSIRSLNFDSIVFKDTLQLFNSSIDYLTISNSTFDKNLKLWNNEIRSLFLFKNNFYEPVLISNDQKEIGKLNIHSSTYFNISSNISLQSEDSTVLFNKTVPYRNQIYIFSNEEIKNIEITQNQFKSEDIYQTVEINCPVGILTVSGNEFESTLDFSSTIIGSQFRMYDNKFSKVSFGLMSFSETYNLIDWDDLKDDEIILLSKRDIRKFHLNDSSIKLLNKQQNYTNIKTFYEAHNTAELNYLPLYDDLIRNYYQLYSSAKQNANIRHANDIYYQLKEIERRLLAHEIEKEFSAKSLVRYLLSSIMAFYTSHGTDPTKAIIISFYIIVFFGLFYSFFPSDWDRTSKELLKQNFNSVIKKDGQFIKPLYFLLTNVLFSFLNGMVLSINSFVTLGFGRIPAQGIAKYACIIQGFLGWFLLSLFTVTLVNQIQY